MKLNLVVGIYFKAR